MFKDYTLQTSWGRAIFAIFGGSIIGASTLTGYFLSERYFRDGKDIFFEHILPTGFGVFFSMGFLWLFGLVLFGLPPWILAHFTGYRTWFVSLIFGFTVPFLVAIWFFFTSEISLADSLFDAAGNAALFSLLGAIVALTIWRIAYRRPVADV